MTASLKTRRKERTVIDSSSAPQDFHAEQARYITQAGSDPLAGKSAHDFMMAVFPHRYTYNFTWLGRPIIQYPQDIIAIQEIIWNVRPDLIVETGIAHGGSLILSASILHLIGAGSVVGVDLEIRPGNREAIESHPLSSNIRMIEGSSVDADVVQQVHDMAADAERVLVMLDSNHTHDHVLKELDAYSGLVSAGSYILVMDTGIEDAPSELFEERPWDKGNNPRTAVRQFLRQNDRFEIDQTYNHKLLVSSSIDGYLKCIQD